MSVSSDWAYGSMSGTVPARDRRTSDRAEAVLLGTLLIAPYLRSRASTQHLRREDFRTPWHGAVFAALMELEIHAPDSVLLLHEIERRREEVPPDMPGWGTAIASLLEDTCVEDDSVDGYVRIIQDAALTRRRGARGR